MLHAASSEAPNKPAEQKSNIRGISFRTDRVRCLILARSVHSSSHQFVLVPSLPLLSVPRRPAGRHNFLHPSIPSAPRLRQTSGTHSQIRGEGKKEQGYRLNLYTHPILCSIFDFSVEPFKKILRFLAYEIELRRGVNYKFLPLCAHALHARNVCLTVSQSCWTVGQSCQAGQHFWV